MTRPSRPFRFTAALVERMVETGVLSEDAPVELLDGELCVVSPQGSKHRMAAVRIRRRLEAAFGDGFWIQDHSPVAAGPHSLPEPDVAVVRGPERWDRHPDAASVPLVVEICETTHREAAAKAMIYAAAGFAEYWIVDLPGRRVTVSTDPAPEGYRRVVEVADGGAVVVAGQPVPVADLLPPRGV